MIYFPQTKAVDSGEVMLAPGVTISAEGQTLVRSSAKGVNVGTGGAGEVFVGFAVCGTSAAPFAEDYASKVEKLVVSAGATVSLAMVPVTGQFLVTKADGSTVATAANVAGSKDITALTGLAGQVVTVTYRYEMSVIQARARQGDPQPGGYSGHTVGQSGCIKRGLVFISEFDAATNWATATDIKVGASGQVTGSGSGAKINGYVVSLPTPEVPFLGIEFSAL